MDGGGDEDGDDGDDFFGGGDLFLDGGGDKLIHPDVEKVKNREVLNSKILSNIIESRLSAFISTFYYV